MNRSFTLLILIAITGIAGITDTTITAYRNFSYAGENHKGSARLVILHSGTARMEFEWAEWKIYRGKRAQKVVRTDTLSYTYRETDTSYIFTPSRIETAVLRAQSYSFPNLHEKCVILEQKVLKEQIR